MPNMKTNMNHYLLMQTIENLYHVQYSDQTVKFVTRVIGDIRNNKMEKVAIFAINYFLNKGLKCFEKKGVVL